MGHETERRWPLLFLMKPHNGISQVERCAM